MCGSVAGIFLRRHPMTSPRGRSRRWRRRPVKRPLVSPGRIASHSTSPTRTTLLHRACPFKRQTSAQDLTALRSSPCLASKLPLFLTATPARHSVITCDNRDGVSSACNTLAANESIHIRTHARTGNYLLTSLEAARSRRSILLDARGCCAQHHHHGFRTKRK